jgi:hypothetical protein
MPGHAAYVTKAKHVTGKWSVVRTERDTSTGMVLSEAAHASKLGEDAARRAASFMNMLNTPPAGRAIVYTAQPMKEARRGR